MPCRRGRASRRSVASGWVATAALVGCAPGGSDPGEGATTTAAATTLAAAPPEGGSSTLADPPSATTTTDDRPALILDAPAAVTPEGWAYLVLDEAPSRVEVAFDGEPIGELVVGRADLPGVLFRVPASAPLGVRTITVTRSADGAVDVREVDVVEPRFPEVAAAAGLDVVHDISTAPPECADTHTGVALADVDGDGRLDVFVGHVGRPAQLFRNLGDPDENAIPDFEDASEAWGLPAIDRVSSATFVDLEGDGDPDLFVGRRGLNRMLRNTAEGGAVGWEDVTEAVGLADHDQRTLGAAFGDADGDDDLDLYVANHAYCFPEPGSEIRALDHLYENVEGVFVERTEAPFADRVTYAASWLDLDADGDQDLVIVRDDLGGEIGAPNAVWRNDGAWAFTDVSEASGVSEPRAHGMGLAFGDVDHDGRIDLAYTNIGPNKLLLNRGDLAFTDVARETGMHRALLPWGTISITWSTHLFDFDNDADLDLSLVGGPIEGTDPMPDAFFEDVGERTFVDRTWSLGVGDPGSGKASALGDLDGDGGLDLLVASWGGPLRFYLNRQPRGGWVGVRLRWRAGNRDGLGSVVALETTDGVQTCFASPQPGLGGGSAVGCHFGIGEADPLAVQVTWPDGSRSLHQPARGLQTLTSPAASGT